MTDIELALIEYDGDGSKPYCDVVYNALKKQQPRLVIEGFGWACPNCHQEYVSGNMDYCPNCGQHLKFES